MDEAVIREKFLSGEPTPKKAMRHHEVARAFTDVALKVNLLMDDGREKSLVMTALEEAAMWANKGIAHCRE